MSGFEFFEHTADVGIRAWGATLDEAFAEAARGLVANMLDLSSVTAAQTRVVSVEAESLERLLFQLLDELLFVTQTDLWIPVEVEVRLAGERALTATLRGEPYDAARHGHIHEIKAITYHDLRVSRAPAEVSVIVDI